MCSYLIRPEISLCRLGYVINFIDEPLNFLDDHLLLPVVLPKLRWGHAFAFFEDAVEVGEVVEAAGIADFSDRLGGVDQKADGEAQADIGQEIDEALAGALLDEAAEGGFAHVDEGGYVGEAYLRLIVAVQVFDHFADAPVFVHRLVEADEGVAGQRTDVVGERELAEDHQEFQDGVESVGLARERPEQRTYLPDRFPSEDDPLLRPVHQFLNALELVLFQQVVGQAGGVELDGDLVDVLRLAFVVHPGMFEVGIGDEHEVFVADRFDRIAHDALRPFGMFDKVEFAFGMHVNREIESRFETFHHNETIFIRQGRYFFKQFGGDHRSLTGFRFFRFSAAKIGNYWEIWIF